MEGTDASSSSSAGRSVTIGSQPSGTGARSKKHQLKEGTQTKAQDKGEAASHTIVDRNLLRAEYRKVLERKIQDKRKKLEKERQGLEDGVHPDFIRGVNTLEQDLQKRLNLNREVRDMELKRADLEHEREVQAAQKEFEEKEAELRATLIRGLEKKLEEAELERHVGIMGDVQNKKDETPAPSTRKLRRRRPTDPTPSASEAEKRQQKTGSLTRKLTCSLDKEDVKEDMQILARGARGSASDLTGSESMPSSSLEDQVF